MRSRIRSGQSGFSLLELFLVILFIAILATIAVPNLIASTRVAREGRAVGNLKTLINTQLLFYGSVGRFGIFDELFKGNFLSTGQFTRNAPTSSGGATSGASEAVSDGTYDYSFRYTTDSQGFTLDADPKKEVADKYRRFRYRINRTAVSSGASGGMGIILVAKPSATSPASSAYKPFNP